MENFYLKPLTPSLHGLRRLAAMVLLLLSAVTAGPAAAGEQDSGKQEPTIQAKGRVVDTNGIAIAGAAVTVKGGSAGGTISDAQGAFTLRVRKGDVLHVSFLGFQAREIAVTDASPLTIRLTEETHQVEDVVVVGYGVQKKESVLGAISQVSNEQLVNSGTTNITNAIAGKLSGVTTIQTGGQPGNNDANIFIRGVSSWNGSTPLVLVDGVERTIRTTDKSVINTLQNNEGKLFHIDWVDDVTDPDYGYVEHVYLVNEYHDNDNIPTGSSNNCTCNYTFAKNVETGDRTITITDRNSNTAETWNTTNATTIVNLDGTTVNYSIENIEEAVENLEVGIWVVEDENGAAAQIYIGTRLSTDAGLNVTSTTEGAKVSQDGNTYTVTLPEDVTSGNITVSATGKNAVLLTDGQPVAQQPFTESKAAGSQRSFTVWAEDGVTNVTYTVEVVGTNNWADIFQNVTNKNDDTELVTGPVRGYKTVEMACANANVVDLNTGSATTVHFNTYPANSIEWRVFTDTADAIGAGVEDYVGMTNNDIGEASLLNGNILMVEVGTSEGTFYTAFAITNPVN